MLSNEIAVLLLKVFIGVSIVGTVVGFCLFWWKNKVVSFIGKACLVCVVVSIISLIVLVFVMSSQPSSDNQTSPAEQDVVTYIEGVSFEEIYHEYNDNELRADDKYKKNRYRITAKVNGMATGGLLNLAGGATLTMEKKVGKTIVVFYAEFEKEQEDNLKQINVGDTITFEGECLSAGSWIECEIVVE